MKTSKYIFYSFIIFVFGSIVVLYATAKIHGSDDYMDDFVTSEVPLEEFSVIVAEKDVKLEIEYSPDFSLESVQTGYDSAYQFPEYTVIRDTLFLTSSESLVFPVLKCNSVNSIIARQDSRIRLGQDITDSLFVDVTGGELYGSFEDSTFIERINIVARLNSRVTFSGGQIRNLDASVDQSRVDVYNCLADTLRVVLKNNSTINAQSKNILQLEKDNTSEYNIRGRSN